MTFGGFGAALWTRANSDCTVFLASARFRSGALAGTLFLAKTSLTFAKIAENSTSICLRPQRRTGRVLAMRLRLAEATIRMDLDFAGPRREIMRLRFYARCASRTPSVSACTRCGVFLHVAVSHGTVGCARLGAGLARRGRDHPFRGHCDSRSARRAVARPGGARSGEAWRGVERPGVAWCGWARRGKASFPHRSCRGPHGWAWLGQVGHGMVR